MGESKVSIIIPTWNNERTIGRCIDSIKKQDYKNVEIIVVDNFSKDNTKEICKRKGVHFFSLNSGRSKARNFGFRKARGQVLFNLDSDMYLTKNVIKACLGKMDEFDAVSVDEKSIGEGFWAKARSFERSLYLGNKSIDAARLFKKEVLRKTGGFDESLTFADDWDFQRRIDESGFKTARVTEVILHDEGKVTLKKAYNSKKFYGRTMKNYFEKNKDAKKKYGIRNILFNILLKNAGRIMIHPVLFSGAVILKATEYFGAFKGARER